MRREKKPDYAFGLFLLFWPIALMIRRKSRGLTLKELNKKRMISEYGYAYYLRNKTWKRIKDKREYETDESWEKRLMLYGYTKNGLHIKTGEQHELGTDNEKCKLDEDKTSIRNITWSEIVASFEKRPREVSTYPLRNSASKWFHVSVKGTELCIESGKEHTCVSKIKGTRKLNSDELEDMLELYTRRMNGESISAKATRKSINQAYWYGIIRELVG